MPVAPLEPDGFRVNGLVELLALDGGQLLALERAFVAGVGNTVRLYLVDLSGADDIHDIDLGQADDSVRSVTKTLLLDLADLGITLDNIEGLTHGPDLPDGRHTLLLISDDNFSPRQKTQVLAFAWSHLPVTLPEIQGAAHRSPYEGQWLFAVEGIVTATSPVRDGLVAWMQAASGDGVDSTSDGVAVRLPEIDLGPGDELVVDGRITERQRPGSLSVTSIEASSLRIRSRGNPLPAARRLGANIPPHVDNDSLASFQPDDDAIDLYESLEGMRVELPASTVTGAASRFGDLVVLPQSAVSTQERTSNGGVLLTDESVSSQLVQVDPRLLTPESQQHLDRLAVGSRIEGPLVGVLDYAFGRYEVVLTEAPGSIEAVARDRQQTELAGSADQLTIATFNVENLDALDSPDKYRRVATVIVEALAAPDVVALQEIQDETGAEDDGVVSADGTLERLLAEIAAIGGPCYDYHQIDPQDNADGGQPGANIRVAYLVDPERVEVPLRGAATAASAAKIDVLDDDFRLMPNPSRVAPGDRAFAFDDNLGYQASRKALALEAVFGGHRILLVNAHLKSKGGDGGLFGSVQPPRRLTESQRIEQARRLRTFVEQLLLPQPDALVVILGDLNEHEFRQPLEELTAGGLVNLIEHVELPDRYTYNFRGTSQVLDHVLVSQALLAEASPKIDIVHVNADYPAAERASDHDPVVVRFDLDAP